MNMMRPFLNSIYLVTVLILLLVISFKGICEAGESDNNRALIDGKNWIEQYYKRKDPEKIPMIMFSLCMNGDLVSDDSPPDSVGFFSEIFKHNPDFLSEWQRQIVKLEKPCQLNLWQSFWYADTKESYSSLVYFLDQEVEDENIKLLKKYLSTTPKNIIDFEITSPTTVDILWGSFMASGEKIYVIKIISSLSLLLEDDDINKVIIGGAIRWGLVDYALSHELVLLICKEEIENQPPKIKEILKSIVQDVEKLKESLR